MKAARGPWDMCRGAEPEDGCCPVKPSLVWRLRWGGRAKEIECQHDSKLMLGFSGSIKDTVWVGCRRDQEISHQFEVLSIAVDYGLDECHNRFR